MADDDRLGRIEGKLDLVITKLEAHIRVTDDVDGRLAKLAAVEKSIANTAMKLAVAKGLTSWLPGAVAGAVAAAVTVLLLSGIAGAH